MDRTFLLIGSILGFLGVAFGAFGAHGLRSRLSADMLAVFETGVRYQMYHVFAILIVRGGDRAPRQRAASGAFGVAFHRRRSVLLREPLRAGSSRA
jgi:uncharacterized membrane protein YgdD (TMEM256/DUF423 family)